MRRKKKEKNFRGSCLTSSEMSRHRLRFQLLYYGDARLYSFLFFLLFFGFGLLVRFALFVFFLFFSFRDAKSGSCSVSVCILSGGLVGPTNEGELKVRVVQKNNRYRLGHKDEKKKEREDEEERRGTSYDAKVRSRARHGRRPRRRYLCAKRSEPNGNEIYRTLTYGNHCSPPS